MSGSVRAWSATHPGSVRTKNEDACLCRPEIGLFAVADGVGGHGGGDMAARQVMAMLGAIPDDLSPAGRLAAVRAGLQRAHAHLQSVAKRSTIGPATTVVVLMLHGSYFACLWAGDSRAYLLRAGRLHPLTRDHSVVQDLVTAGTLTEAQAQCDPRQNIITRAVGAGQEDLLVEKMVGQVLPDDLFLLCTDGLYKTLEPTRFADVLTHGAGDVAERLVQAALSGYARDNVTAVVVAP